MTEALPVPDYVLDAGETACGDLVMQVFSRIKTLRAGEILEVVGYDPGALIDIPAWCRQSRNTLLHTRRGENTTAPNHFFIRKEEY